MAKVSVIIPSRNEHFLQKTIDDLLEKAEGDVEIVVVMDGTDQDVRQDKRVVKSPEAARTPRFTLSLKP